MYGLPSSFNTSLLVGKELSEVSFSANTVSLSFGDYALITVMGSFVHRCKDSTYVNKETIPLSSSALMSLVGKTVRLAEARQDGTLSLHFENSDVLVLLDDSKQYESYIIRIGNEETIV